MPKKPNFRLIVPLVAAVFLILYYTLLILNANPKALEKDLTHSIELMTGGQFQSDSFKIGYFPTLESEFQNVTLQIQEPNAVSLKCRKLKIYFGFWGFLFGKPGISAIEMEGGSVQAVLPAGLPFQNASVENIKLRARMLQSFKKIQVQWEGNLEGVKQSFTGKILMGMQDPMKRDWNQVFMNGDVWLKNFPSEILKNSFFQKRNIQIKEGKLSGQYHLQKEKQDPWLYLSGHSQMVNLVYEVQSEASHLLAPATSIDFDLEAGWQPLDEQVLIKRSYINLPFGKVQVSGRVHAGNKEIKDIRVTVSDLMLEILPQYYLPFREAVPFNLGFSGKSSLEMSLDGALDHLAFHGNWDLSSSFLNYAQFFSKPKDVPCNLSFDLLLKNSRVLAGDFSLKLNDAGFKGSLSNFDITNGAGDLNILSNKFLLEHWTPLLPVFSSYDLSGEIKVLANFSGSLLRHPQEVKSMVNVILEKGQISKGNEALKGIYFALDYSPLSLEVKEGQVLAGSYPLFFNLTLFDPKTNPHAKINIHSEQADVTKLISSLDAIGKKWLPREANVLVERLHPVMESLVPEGQTLDRLKAEVEIKPEEIALKSLKCELYEGDVAIKGKVNPGNTTELFSADVDVDHLNLARFFARNPKEPQLMGGSFFIDSEFHGKNLSQDHWQEGFTGKGSVSVTNGEFHSFSVLKILSTISGFSMLAEKASDITPFDDLRSGFKVENSKITTDKAALISREIKASGDGEISFDGLVNYRLDTYLSTIIAKDVIGSYFGGNASDNEGEYLGPIPLLLSGAFDQPELKTDPSKIAEFTENFSKKKTQKVLRNFLPEDVLFKRPSKS